MSLRSAYSTIFTPVLTPDQPFQGRIDAAIPGNLSVGDSTTNYSMSLNGQTISSSNGILSVSGGLSITGNLNASGGTFRGPVNISGITTVSALNVQNYLNVSGLSTVSGLTVQRNLNVSGSAAISSNMTVTQTASAGLVYTTTISGLTRINGAPYIPGGNPYNWSDYPAISDVSFGAHNLSNINNVNISGGAIIDGVLEVKTQVSAASVYATNISGVALINGAPYVPGIDPANWATYPAVTNLDMSGSNVGNVNALNISGTSVFDGSLNVNNIATIVSNFNVSGLANLSGATVHNRLTVSGILSASGATIQSNIVVAGSVLANAATVSNNLGVSGSAVISNATIQNTLNVSGLTTLTSANVVSTFNVSGLATLSGATVQNTLSATNVYTTTISGVSTINGTPFNPAGIPTLWANYPATSNVNMSGSNIFNINNVNASGFSVLAGGLSVPALATVSDLVVQNTKIHLGTDAGNISQASNTVAIGVSAGYSNQGLNAIAIGNKAGLSNQASNSIILNASSNALNASVPGFFVTPVGQSSNLSGLQIMTYNPATFQLQQNSNVTISGGRLGVGTATPNFNVHVVGSVYPELAIADTTNGSSYMSLLRNHLGDVSIIRATGRLDIESPANFSRVTILSNGNIGIGLVNPSSLLHMSNSADTTLRLQSTYTNSTSHAKETLTKVLFANTDGSTTYGAGIQMSVPSNSTINESDLEFTTCDNDGNQQIRMIVKGSGNANGGRVGINTTNPSGYLHVNGNARIDDDTGGTPANGTMGGTGTRLVLYRGDAGNTPNALGIGAGTMWYGTNSTGTHTWYAGTQSNMSLDSVGNLTVRGTVNCTTKFESTPAMWCYSRQNISNTIGYGSNTIPWTNADYEYSSALTPGANTGGGATAYANSHWYAPFNGTYKISMNLHIDSGYIGVYKNDSFIDPGQPWGRSTSLGAAGSGLSTGNAAILIVLTLAANDKISFQLYTDPDDQTTALGGTFIVELIKKT